MIKKILIKDIPKNINKSVLIKGWVYNLRSSGSIIFLQVRDGTGFIQSTVNKEEVSRKAFKDAQNITLESSIEFQGIVKEDKRAPGGFEVSVNDLKLVNLANEDYPIGKKEHGPDFLLSNRHLWLRTKKQWAIQRVRNQIIMAINEYMHVNNYLKIDTPIITPAACEGTTTLFEIDYFGEKAYLSQSGQLYLEAAIASFGKCYDFGPALRAEKSKTRRHLIEFWIMDAEAAFMNFSQILEVQEQLVDYVLKRVLKNNSLELNILERDTSLLKKIKLPYLRMTYKQAVKKLNDLGSDIKYGSDLGNDDETILMKHIKQPLFITHYPADIKAFYCKRYSQDNKLTLSADLLAPEGYGEIIGGGEREDDYNKLLDRIKKHKYNLKDYQWYLDLRKYGSVPHSGFGLGLERWVTWICKLKHVRESIPFPRLLERFRP